MMLPAIIESKIKYLNNYNIFPLVTNFIKNKNLIHNEHTEICTVEKILQAVNEQRNLMGLIKKKLKNYLLKISNS